MGDRFCYSGHIPVDVKDLGCKATALSHSGLQMRINTDFLKDPSFSSLVHFILLLRKKKKKCPMGNKTRGKTRVP